MSQQSKIDNFSASESSLAIRDELINALDRYSQALETGDHAAAEAIIQQYPAIESDFRVPLERLYLLGRATRGNQFDAFDADDSGRRQLGDYEIEYELGRGGMGTVYAATQISLRRRVALKVLPFAAVLDPRQVARFRNEAQAAASLHHPNIVPVYGVGCERGMHYYSMQLIEGQSLEELITQLRAQDQAFSDRTERVPGSLDATSSKASHSPGSAPAATRPTKIDLDTHRKVPEGLTTAVSIRNRNYVRGAIELGIQAANAIDFAHQQGIVHRDIKPSNLLLDQTGKVWVADFGLAQCRGANNLTSQGERIGTARYMSPEQAAGRKQEVDFRSDIFSLGVTIYELLTLRPAFEAQTREQLLAAIESQEPASMCRMNSAIPVDLQTVIGKAISKSPQERYRSAGEFADDLQRCLVGKPIVAKRPTAIGRLSKAVAKRKRLATSCAAAIVGFAVTAAVLASIFFQQRERERFAAEQARFHLQQAHLIVERFSDVWSNRLMEIPGTERLQAELLSEEVAYYEDFIAYAADSVELKFERAQATSQLARLLERIGDDEQSITHFKSAIIQWSALADESRQERLTQEATIEQAICLSRLGLLQKQRGNYVDAEVAMNESLQRFDSLDREAFARDDVLAAQAQSRANLGSLNWSKGELTAAAANFKQALNQLMNRLDDLDEMHDVKQDTAIDNNHANADLQSVFLKVQGNYVAVLSEFDPEQAEKVLQDAIAGLESQGTECATTRETRLRENARHLADMRNNLAILLFRRGELDEAQRLTKESIKFWRSEVAENQLELTASVRLATSLNTLGEIHWREGQLEPSDAAFAAAERLLQDVVASFPDRPESFSRLGGVLHNRSLVAHSQTDEQAARGLINLAIEFQTRAVRLAPENVRYQQFLASHEKTMELIMTSATDNKTATSNTVEPAS